MDILGGKTGDTVTTLGAVGIGILAWEAAATGKYNRANYSLFSISRFSDALSGLIGKDLALKITGNPTGADMHPNFFGWANKITGSGVIGYIVNQVLKAYVPKYKDFDAIAEFVDKVTAAIAVGGVVGGIFDPNPSGFSVMGMRESGGVASGNVPFGRGEGHNGHLSVVS